MTDFIAFVRFVLWSLTVHLCDLLPPSGHYDWCGIHHDVPEVLDERWWDLMGWKKVS